MSVQQSTESKLKIRQVRHFSTAFKEKVVSDIDKGLTSIREVSSLYDINKAIIYRWIYRYSIHHKQGTRMVVEMESEGKKTEFLQKRVAELERIIGQKQLTIDYLERLIHLASAHYETDVKKNFATEPLSTSETTNRFKGT